MCRRQQILIIAHVQYCISFQAIRHQTKHTTKSIIIMISHIPEKAIVKIQNPHHHLIKTIYHQIDCYVGLLCEFVLCLYCNKIVTIVHRFIVMLITCNYIHTQHTHTTAHTHTQHTTERGTSSLSAQVIKSQAALTLYC